MPPPKAPKPARADLNSLLPSFMVNSLGKQPQPGAVKSGLQYQTRAADERFKVAKCPFLTQEQWVENKLSWF